MFPRLLPVTRNLLIANVAVYLLQLTLGAAFEAWFALWPVGHGFMPWQLLTSGFMHGNFSHLLFNMLALAGVASSAAGAAAARGDYLWFVHADTRVSPEAIRRLLDVLIERPLWGRFDVRLSARGPMFRLIGNMISLRSRLTGIASGDQGIFVDRATFEALGGYADIPLMEDLELCRRLKRLAWPCCLRPALITSSRRWEQQGIWRTLLLMWRLRLAYYCGVSPEKLARQYQRGAPP